MIEVQNQGNSGAAGWAYERHYGNQLASGVPCPMVNPSNHFWLRADCQYEPDFGGDSRFGVKTIDEDFESPSSYRGNIALDIVTQDGYAITFEVNKDVVNKSVLYTDLGHVQGGNFVFSIPEDITVTPNSNKIASFNDISIYEGTYLTKSFKVISSQTNQRFILPNPNVDTSSIRVEVKENGSTLTYNAYTNIFDVNSESRLFLVQEIDDEKYQIMFGDGVLGKKPGNGAEITVSYIVTNGENGNGAANFNFSGTLTSNTGATILEGISLLTTIQSSENGDSIESTDNVKYLAPRVYASQYRAVTPNDYKSLIPFLYPNIDSVSAYGGEELDPPEFGKVYITVKPKNGEVLSDVVKDSIKNDLKKYTVAGIKQEFLDLKYLYVEFNSTVSFDTGFISDKLNLQSRILSAIENYAKSSDINSFGGRLKYSKLLSQIDKVDNGITSNITTLVIRRNLIPSYNTLATYEVCYGNKFHADLEGFNVRSSAFKIDGVEGDIYLTDFPNDDQLTGIIKFFTITDGIITYINNNAGTIDYVKGEVILFPVTITSTSLENRIEIEVTPESNDIVAKENLYIVLDTTGNSKLNLLEDVLVSGSNISGTNYTPPSSFISNKKYIR